MSRKMRNLLILLGVLVVIGAIEYTVGGGWKMARDEYSRITGQGMPAGAHYLMQPFTLPQPIGPKDAKLRIEFFFNTRNGCHAGMAQGAASAFEKYKDRVRVVFYDISSEQAQKKLAGYPKGCEMAGLINGLMSVRMPGKREPIMAESLVGKMGPPADVNKFVAWALTPEGQKSLAQQRKAFEAERKRRLEKEKAAAAKGKSGPGAPPPPGSLPPGLKQPWEHAQPGTTPPPSGGPSGTHHAPGQH
ncbi:MAG: hypothetical protein N2512_02195 [Armatimonadetes bacterium]|nr:hypothetical protein [Armatimonadota bacterium]